MIRSWVREQLSGQEDDLFERLVDEFSRLVLSEALGLTDGNRSQAARLLGISRPTLHARMDKYGITVGARINGGGTDPRKGGNDGGQGR